MKVLMLSPLPPPVGGIATWTQKYMRQSSKWGIQLKVINEAHIGKNGKRIINKISIKEELFRTSKILIQTFLELFLKKYSIIHINSSCGTGLIRDYCAARFGKFFNVKIFLHCHCNIEDQLKNNRIGEKYFPKIMNISDCVFVLNSTSYQKAEQYTKKVVLLPNFIDKDYITTEHYCSIAIKSIFYCGRITKSKGSDELFKVADMLPNIQFVLAGMLDDNYKVEELPQNIKLLGQIDGVQIKEHLDRADIFLFPSHSEGFSVSVLEAMARGVPCVVSDVGANFDMIENMGGIVLDEITPENIVMSVKALNNMEIRKKASIWNIEKVKKNYLASKVMNDIFKNYCSVIGQTIV